MIPISTLLDAIKNGYVVYSRKKGGSVVYPFTLHQEARGLPIVKVYLKTTYAQVTVDVCYPLSKEKSRKVYAYLWEKDKHTHKPFSLRKGNYSLISASMIPIEESIEVAKQVVLLLNGEG